VKKSQGPFDSRADLIRGNPQVLQPECNFGLDRVGDVTELLERVLEDIANASHEVIDLQCGRGRAVEDDFAAQRPLEEVRGQASQQVAQRGLAGARRTEDTVEPARLECEIHTGQCVASSSCVGEGDVPKD
jgi:hypothetical protein